ncbi:MAG: DUF2325 domain-containing protein [Methanophagales archaeon]|nr:DUF2325 domain-containing protein [Methanophagales archaeon]
MAEGKGRGKGTGTGTGNGKRRIWEFQSFTICRLLGLSFDERELRRLFKELKLSHDNQFSAAFEMHQQLAQICRTQNQHAKRVEKILEKQFAPYKKEVALRGLDVQKICEFIEGRTENTFKDIPISALIWFAARNENGGQNNGVAENKSKEIETRIFTAVHLKEHQALRFYDELSRKLPGGEAEDILGKLRTALESNKKLHRNYKRSEQKKEELISEREAIKEDKVRLVHELEEQRRLNERLRRKVKEMGGEAAFEQIDSMKNELGALREEIKRVNKENAELIKISASASASASNFNFNVKTGMKKEMEDKFAVSACGCNGNHNEMEMGPQLKDVRVAYVGGVESLETCYKEMAESFGCLFCYHCGHCEGGKKAMEGIVEKNDVIFCPIDINSHNACLLVKKACKLRNKHCYFLRSSGLSALKRGLMNFAVEICGQRG